MKSTRLEHTGQAYQELDFWTKHALAEISSTYGDSCALKPKSLHKFGQHPDLDTADGTSLVWSLGGDKVTAEDYQSTNSIDSISSGSASDTGDVVVEYHTIDGSGNLTFGVQTVTLAGQTRAALDTPCARVSRVKSVADLVGDVYVYENGSITNGVPDDLTTCHAKVLAGANQTQKAATSTSSQDYFLCTRFYAFPKKSASAAIDVQLRTRRVDLGEAFRDILPAGMNSVGGVVNIEFKPYLIIPKNSDIIVTASTSANNTGVAAGFHGMFALVKS